jgi:hypothetical protein
MQAPKRRRFLALSVLAMLAGCSGPAQSTEPAAAPASSAAAVEAAPSARPPSSEDPTVAPDPAPGLAVDLPSRVVIEDLEIDLAVISGDATVPGNPNDYPLCDVAQYLTTYRYPGRPGTTTWIYAHAREGMFLPLLGASQKDEGASLLGARVDLYSTGARRYVYVITDVFRHATDRSVGRDVPAAAGRLVLQTSEGPTGTIPKLQVVAELVASEDADPRQAEPSADPRGCFAG